MIILRKIIFGFILILAAVWSIGPACAQVEFVENKGQWDNRVNYRGDFAGGAFFLENHGFTVLLHNPSDLQKVSEIIHGHNTPFVGAPVTLHSHAYKVNFEGAASLKTMRRVPDKLQDGYNNYFIGNDPTKWAGDCKVYQAVTYENLYPNIDIRYYSDGGRLKYDLIVRPGGNVASIAMKYSGAGKLSIKNKELVIPTSVGEVKELYPYSYQTISGKRNTINCRYAIDGDIVRFKIDEYAANQTLIIDPTLIFSTFTGSTQDNWGYTATPGPDGSFFAGGISFGSGFPVSPGAAQVTFQGGPEEYTFPPYDIAIMKFHKIK